jgi:hypothetical protein
VDVVVVAPENPFLDEHVIGELSDWSVDEEATPIVPGDSSGGTPSLNVTGIALDRWAMAAGQPLELDTARGSAMGKVSEVSMGEKPGMVTLTADSLLNRLNIDVQALPYYSKTGDIASDTFTRAASTTSLGVLPTGQEWVQHRGIWGINNNQAYNPSASSLAVAGVLVGNPDHEVSCTISGVPAGGARGGLFARMNSLESYFWADFDSTGAWRLGVRSRNLSQTLKSGTGALNGSRLTLRVVGNVVTLLVNAAQVATATAVSPQVGGWAGITSNGTIGNAAIRWDNFVVTNVSAGPGTLYNGFVNLTRLAGVPDDLVEVDPEIQYDAVIFPGFVGNLWDNIKQMCAVYGYQCYSTGSKIGLTKVGKVVMEILTPDTASTSISMGDVAQRVQITNYRYTSTTQGIFFKADQVYSLEAGETQENSVQVKGTPATLNDPVCVDGMDLKATGGLGQYVVTGEDGYIMAPQLWRDLGGRVSARLSTESADEVIITITAPNDKSRAPYRISEGDDRPALWITGAGVLSDPKVHTLYTGYPDAPQRTTDPIENVFVANQSLAYTAGARLAQKFSGPTVTLNISGVPDLTLTRLGYTYTVPPLATQYRVAEQELTAWFGSLAGAILQFGDAKYRVISAAVHPVGVDLTLVQHTTFADFDAVWAGKTFGDFNTAVGPEIAFEQLNIFPLTTGV